METMEIEIRDMELIEWAIKKYGSWMLFQEEYSRREKVVLEEITLPNLNDTHATVTYVDKTFLKEYIQEEISDSIIEVISWWVDIEHGTTYLVEYTKEVR